MSDPITPLLKVPQYFPFPSAWMPELSWWPIRPFPLFLVSPIYLSLCILYYCHKCHPCSELRIFVLVFPSARTIRLIDLYNLLLHFLPLSAQMSPYQKMFSDHYVKLWPSSPWDSTSFEILLHSTLIATWHSVYLIVRLFSSPPVEYEHGEDGNFDL